MADRKRPARGEHPGKSASAKPAVDADTRTRLVDAALRIILDHGVDAVRIDDVLAEVGVTKGSLYWHFEDRDALVKAALAEHISRLNASTISGVSDAIANATDKDAYLSRVSGLLADPFDAEQVRERWSRLAVLVEARNDAELMDLMRDVQSRHINVFVELMSDAQQHGLLRGDVDPHAVAVALNAMYLGSNIIDVLGETAPSPDAWWNLMFVFLETLFPSGAGPAEG